MKNKGFNPLFISALDILTGALGAFIILNFLNNLQPRTPIDPKPMLAEKTGKQPGTSKPDKPVQPTNTYTGWWRKSPRTASEEQNKTSTTQNNASTTVKPEETTAPRPVQPPMPPQDPVTVDLMKQTQGAVVLLIQQPDKAKSMVEMMLRQGSKTWKPSRASKYQDNTFAYQKGLNYFYQTEIQPGTYEVLVRIKKNSNAQGQEPVGFYGKLVPPGSKSITYNFGMYGVSSKEWTSAGSFTVSAHQLTFGPRLSKIDPNTIVSNFNTQPSPPVAATPAKKKGKWD